MPWQPPLSAFAGAPPVSLPGASKGKGTTQVRFLTRTAVALTAVTALAGFGLSAAGAASAATHPTKNATLVCGFNCFNLSNLQLDGTGTGAFIQNAVGGAAGTSINLRAEGIAKTDEDFQTAVPTTVLIACTAHLLSATSIFCVNPSIFLGDLVFEANFAPDSNQSGLCVALPTANTAGRLALKPCGASPTTLWVDDTANFHVSHGGQTYSGWLNGGDTNFSHPLALTVNPSSKTPKNVLRADTENLTASFLPDTQLFTETFGHAGT